MSYEQLKRVQKHFYAIVFIKCTSSLLNQIGLLHAGKASMFLVVTWPLFLFIIGNYLVKILVTEQRAPKLLEMLPVFYIILIIFVGADIISFLWHIGIATMD